MRNKEVAIDLLKARLLEARQKQRVDELAQIRGDAIAAEWGQQIDPTCSRPTRWSRTRGRRMRRRRCRTCWTASSHLHGVLPASRDAAAGGGRSMRGYLLTVRFNIGGDE